MKQNQHKKHINLMALFPILVHVVREQRRTMFDKNVRKSSRGDPG